MVFSSSIPVSYTHLDVYKRQFLGLEDTILYAACFDANGGVFEPLFTEEDAIISDELNHASIIDGVRPVSYTHLDVYKRQE